MAMNSLGQQPAYFSGCCFALSKPLLSMLLDRLPHRPAMTLSIGCGSGLFESMLLEASRNGHGRPVNLYGVEVESCANGYLSNDRLLRVPSTVALHPDAILASCLIFVYPRDASLIERYVQSFSKGALETVFWLGHRNDWSAFEAPMHRAFSSVEYVEAEGIAESELIVIASLLKHGSNDSGQ